MDREEMMDFLRENLSIEITTSRERDYSDEYISINVSLNLTDGVGRTETISECSDTIDINT
jgi:hypothetical protein